MRRFYKRQRVAILLVLAVLLLNGCAKKENDDFTLDATEKVETICSVTYFDVGAGDCTLIECGGKNYLIDCGSQNPNAYEKVFQKLKGKKIETLDVFILSNPCLDQICFAPNVMEDFSVKKIYLPKIHQDLMPEFATFNEVVEKISEKQIETEFSKTLLTVESQDFLLTFLSPDEESYNKLLKDSYSLENWQNLSPIIYLEVKGVRFLFLGDSGRVEQKFVCESYNAKYYQLFLGENKVKLENIDFLKVARHGEDGSALSEFVELVNPKNAVISRDSSINKSASYTTELLLKTNKDVNILRTDALGNIEISITKKGQTLYDYALEI